MKRALGGVVLGAAIVAFWVIWRISTTAKDEDRAEAVPSQPDSAVDAGDDSTTELPPVLVGEVRVELSRAPRDSYWEGDDEPYRAFVERHPQVQLSPSLGRAAREYALQSVVLGAEPSDRVMSFLLHAAGAPDFTAMRYVVATNDDGDEALVRAVATALSKVETGSGSLFMGIGESHEPDAQHGRRIGILIARRRFELEKTPRLVRPGQRWSVRGRVDASLGELSASALLPSGELVEVPVRRRGDEFEAELGVGSSKGTVWLSVEGRDPRAGPVKLMQLSAEVGSELQRERIFRVPPEEEWSDVRAAERYAIELINRDRTELGLDRLEVDSELVEVARAHSEDMRDHSFFGHLSPRTGSVAERLKRRGYRASTYAENLARNDRIAEAQAALMWSVGHRRNLVSTRFDRVGVGIARSADRRNWFVTQVFARAAPLESVEVVRDALFERVNEMRVAAGRAEVGEAEHLRPIAQQALASSTELPGDEAVSHLARALRDHLRSSAQLVVISALDHHDVALPEWVAGEQLDSLVVGVTVLDDGRYRIALVGLPER